MKKLLFILSIIPAALLSCKKDQSSNHKVSAKGYKVTFNVTNFTQKQTNFSLRNKAHTFAVGDTVNVGAYLDLFYYVVLDDHNNPVKVKAQDSTMANMGMITDTLPAGNYTIAMVAGKKGLHVTATFGIGSFFDYNGNPWLDTFFDSFPLTVGSTDITQNVTLSRVVGKLEVKITNPIPANTDSLLITINGDAVNKQLLTGDIGNTKTTTYHVAIPPSAIGTSNFTVDEIVGGSANPNTFDVTLTAKGPGNNVIISTTYSPVPMYNNEKTIMSAPLFQSSQTNGQQSFTVKVDTAWNPTPINQTFGLNRSGSVSVQKTYF